MILLSKHEVEDFYHLMDQHRYSEALPYGQSLLDKDSFDIAGIRFGLMSACVMLKNVKAAEEIAQKIAKSMKISLADVPLIQNKKNWLSYLDPAMLYPLAMVHWKIGTEKTGNTAVCEYGACGAEDAGVAGSTGTVILKTVMKTTLEYVALSVLWWPLGLALLAGLIIAKIREGKINQKTGATKILNSLKPNIVEGMHKNKDKFVMDIEQPVSAIIRAGNELSGSFTKEVEAYNNSLDSIIADLTSNSSAAAEEEARTGMIKAKLIEVISTINESINGSPLDEEGIRKLA